MSIAAGLFGYNILVLFGAYRIMKQYQQSTIFSYYFMMDVAVCIHFNGFLFIVTRIGTRLTREV